MALGINNMGVVAVSSLRGSPTGKFRRINITTAAAPNIIRLNFAQIYKSRRNVKTPDCGLTVTISSCSLIIPPCKKEPPRPN